MQNLRIIIEKMMEPGGDLLSTTEIMNRTSLTSDMVLLTLEQNRGLFESCVSEEDGVQAYFWLKNRKDFKSVFAAWTLSGKIKNDFLLSKDEEAFFDALINPEFSGYRSINAIKSKANLLEHELQTIADKFERINLIRKTKSIVGFTAEGQYFYFILLINKIFFD